MEKWINVVGHKLHNRLDVRGKDPLPPLETDSEFKIRKALETGKYDGSLQSC
jgi:hypothetical protein